MKKRKYLITIAVIGFLIFIWHQEPPKGIGLTNQFIGTYACQTDPQCYITVYKDGNFYYYNQTIFHYKGVFKESAKDTYALSGKKITPQSITSKERSFRFLDGETELSFKKIYEIPLITETVKKLAE
ncbi:hypothetical protein [Anaerotignum propionicum]|uniref:DUF4367 domain-containing protein n=1 Tax=Anaerotignum propionicum DSM 1682 TaxID=991789 RepID=A0A0X8VA39_ANAPI|nr:hypothetical protein [Anaerotignum propionicum]AMJ40173.1 hypothetical protein CPRO_05700 [Anaerotignum propionicum DSM 1682]SHF09793.1 hypothetical protein SAMN02745151_02765 [[Clostridium] propionicum DSM 1682] [Anaerotignum propionicum DSM 1682]